MYIVILNYESGRVCAFDLSYKPEDMDAEEYTETTLDYSLQNCEWMVVDEKPHIEFLNA